MTRYLTKQQLACCMPESPLAAKRSKLKNKSTACLYRSPFVIMKVINDIAPLYFTRGNGSSARSTLTLIRFVCVRMILTSQVMYFHQQLFHTCGTQFLHETFLPLFSARNRLTNRSVFNRFSRVYCYPR